VCTLLEGGDNGAGEGEFLLETGRHRAALGDASTGVGYCSTELCQHGDTLLEYGKLVDGERRASGDMGTHERGEVRRGSHPALRGAAIDGPSISGPEPYCDSIGRRLAF
jgi:hypothetical protein